MSDFMQRQITGLENWLRVETTQGSEVIRIADVGLFVRNSEQISQPLTDDERAEYANQIQGYVEGTPETWENVKGYGARLSAYLDCTEWSVLWSVFETEEEAREYLNENYPEDEQEEN